MHPNAEAAAETAEFADAHGKFREMHDLLFENQERLSVQMREANSVPKA
jgi:protein-disulfide isomerase